MLTQREIDRDRGFLLRFGVFGDVGATGCFSTPRSSAEVD